MATSQFDPSVARAIESVGIGAVSMVFKAQGYGDHVVPPLVLTATNEFPRCPPGTVDLAELRRMHVADAEVVVNAIYASLPGGTLDQILRLMLERKASQLVVTF